MQKIQLLGGDFGSGVAYLAVTTSKRLLTISTSPDPLICAVDIVRIEVTSKEHAGNKVKRVYYTIHLRDEKKIAASSDNETFQAIQGASISPITDKAEIAKLRAEVVKYHRQGMWFLAFLLVAVVAWCSLPPKQSATSSPERLEGSSLFPGVLSFEWGTSQEEILRKAGATEDRSNVHLKYTDTVLGLAVIVGYVFDSGSLEGTVYRFERPLKDPIGHYEAYQKLRLHLVERYGQPVMVIDEWKNEKYKKEPSQWSLAVTKGHYRTGAKWASGDTEILLLLAGSKGKADLVVSANRASSRIFETNPP